MRTLFDKVCIRSLATLFMVVGVAICLVPYVAGRMSSVLLFLIPGLLLTIACGLVRCYLTEGECREDQSLGHQRQG